jgi:subtilisin family serine protease
MRNPLADIQTAESAGVGQPEDQPLDTRSLPTGPTGRTIVTLRPEGTRNLARALQNIGLQAATSSDFEGAAVREDQIGDANALLLEHIDVAIVDASPEQTGALQAAVEDTSNPVMTVEPEVYVVPFCEQSSEDGGDALLTTAGEQYLRGYFAAIRNLETVLSAGAAGVAGAVVPAVTFVDTAAFTWGLQATRVSTSRCSGAGIRVAVLDTGFDLNHADFVGRSIVSQSFVPGQPVQDGHSHGTHCIGTACGPQRPAGNVRRYGIAYGATILVGKVLSNSGSGTQGGILNGINWAIHNRAVVISMSLGSPVRVGETFSPAYEQAAHAALNNNCLIVAAAGNSGADPVLYPVGSPANCPSIMAIAALDPNLQRSSFSCRGVNPNGGELNVAAPGRNVFSSVPMNMGRYGVKSGTSMATPHVAGIAALLAQNTGLRGMALWRRLEQTARNIHQPVQNVGRGLVQAPQCT